MSLQSLQIIITRPKHQAQDLADYVESLQGKAILLPMIDIQSMSIDSTMINTVKKADLVIISSQNAVWFAPDDLIEALMLLPIITIGPSTTKALNDKEISVLFTAPKGSQSETLLEAKCLQSAAVKNKSIVILTGKGGRDLIATILQTRGASVTNINVYQQVPIEHDFNVPIQEWQHSGKQTCFIFTSLNILDNFITQIPKQYLTWICSQPIIVVSPRIELHAKKCGFQHIFNAKGADLQSLAVAMDSIKKLCFTGERS